MTFVFLLGTAGFFRSLPLIVHRAIGDTGMHARVEHHQFLLYFVVITTSIGLGSARSSHLACEVLRRAPSPAPYGTNTCQIE